MFTFEVIATKKRELLSPSRGRQRWKLSHTEHSSGEIGHVVADGTRQMFTQCDWSRWQATLCPSSWYSETFKKISFALKEFLVWPVAIVDDNNKLNGEWKWRLIFCYLSVAFYSALTASVVMETSWNRLNNKWIGINTKADEIDLTSIVCLSMRQTTAVIALESHR